VAQNKLGGPRRRQPLTKPTGERTWQMQYHAEQFPDERNRVSLSESQKDSTGAPALKIDFRFTDRDFDSVVRAHELLDADLQAAGAGRLKMHGDREASIAAVRRLALDGYHQLGGAMMSRDPKDGVVDVNCRAHGLDNLFVVSGAVFPSGSQANPTLTIVSLALRLAERISAGAQSVQ
jgi:choline dehydrogenase-like flavoprotein